MGDRSNGRGLTGPQKWVVYLGFLLLILGVGNLGRAVMALRYARLLPDLPMTVSWTYLAAMGGFWGVALTAGAVGMVLFRPWARWLALAVTTLYQGHVWVNHLLFDANEYAVRTWPRDLVLSLALLGLVWGVLSWPSVRREFEDGQARSVD